ncbi:hypothetical protein UPYG_G00273510 [Umbra pygmaea]|uniref:BPTI/Kunitz inhibitor domain-containing protein n=1 Tax=Umbra pygmaea TaxID=75934 RepID=A0ABD0X1S1_UMBPY
MKLLIILCFVLTLFYIVHANIPEFCSLPLDEGTPPVPGSEDFVILLYYDVAKDLCYPFKYRGEGGNANRFTLEKYCIRNCSTRAEALYPMDESKACHLKKNLGECFGSYVRFYYDPIHQKCKKFHWTGCVGNGNRFFNQETCNSTCTGIHDLGDEEEEYEPDTPVAMILGVVFGITGSILLVIVIVLFIKSSKTKKSHKRASEKDQKVQEKPLNEIPMVATIE